MYSKEQITFLMSNGFSVEEIMQMQDPKPDPQPDPKPDPKPDPQPDPKSDPKPDPKQDQKPDPQMTSVLTAVNQLISTIQGANINGMQFGSPQPDRSVDDILAEIINPPQKK